MLCEFLGGSIAPSHSQLFPTKYRQAFSISSVFCFAVQQTRVFWNAVRPLERFISNFPVPNLSKFCANSSVDAGQHASACACCWWTDSSLQTPNRINDVRSIEPGGSLRGLLPSATLLLEIHEKTKKKRNAFLLILRPGPYILYSCTVSVQPMHNIH
jgi:hypothetical protein